MRYVRAQTILKSIRGTKVQQQQQQHTADVKGTAEQIDDLQ